MVDPCRLNVKRPPENIVGDYSKLMPGVAMLLVIQLEELLTEDTSVLNAAEPFRELRTVFHGSELAFRIRIVVGNAKRTDRLEVETQRTDSQ